MCWKSCRQLFCFFPLTFLLSSLQRVTVKNKRAVPPVSTASAKCCAARGSVNPAGTAALQPASRLTSCQNHRGLAWSHEHTRQECVPSKHITLPYGGSQVQACNPDPPSVSLIKHNVPVQYLRNRGSTKKWHICMAGLLWVSPLICHLCIAPSQKHPCIQQNTINRLYCTPPISHAILM